MLLDRVEGVTYSSAAYLALTLEADATTSLQL